MEPQLQKVSFCEVCKGLLVLLHSFQFICQVLEGDKSIAASQENFSNIINPSRTHDYYNSSVTFCRSLSSTCCKQFTPPFLCRKFVCSSLSNSPLGLRKNFVHYIDLILNQFIDKIYTIDGRVSCLA